MTDDNVLKLPLRPGQEIPDREDRDWVTSTEILAETPISYRQLDYWCRTGLLRPLEEPRPGSGAIRRFHADQVDRVRALYDLLAAGLSLVTCRQVIDQVLATGHATVGPITITRTPGGDAA